MPPLSSNPPSLETTSLSSNAIYPTKEEILQNLYNPTTAEVAAVKRWKATYYKGWNNASESQKFFRLKTLITELAIAHNVEIPRYAVGWYWAYFPEEKLISGGVGSPSIISALHELGHHIFGTPELTACTYSVGIFSTCFPKAYEKLTWKGHMLVRQ